MSRTLESAPGSNHHRLRLVVLDPRQVSVSHVGEEAPTAAIDTIKDDCAVVPGELDHTTSVKICVKGLAGAAEETAWFGFNGPRKGQNGT